MVNSIALTLLFAMFAVGLYHRLKSQQSGEALDRSKEGWWVFAAIRITGLAGWVAVILAFRGPAFDLPEPARWVGVALVGLAVAWLMWMFRSLGRNLTDTVVTRRDSVFVEHGPYRYVRNPMYSGLLTLGWGLGLALASWVVPLVLTVLFGCFAIRVRTEEAHLIARFGGVYEDYMRRVGRFTPIFRRSLASGQPRCSHRLGRS